METNKQKNKTTEDEKQNNETQKERKKERKKEREREKKDWKHRNDMQLKQSCTEKIKSKTEMTASIQENKSKHTRG